MNRTITVTITAPLAIPEEHVLSDLKAALVDSYITVTRDETQPPELDHDRHMFERYGSTVNANGKLERRIVWNMFRHLAADGWLPTEVFDGDDTTKVVDAKSAMEHIFNLDECWVTLNKPGAKGPQKIFLVLGNGTDIISNYTIGQGDPLTPLLDAFDTTAYE